MRRVLALLFLLVANPAWASRALTTGFEELAAGQEAGLATTLWTTVTGSPVISTTQKHSGTNSLQFNPSAAVIIVSRSLGVSQTDGEQWVRLYVYISTLPGANTPIGRWLNSGSTGTAQLTLSSTGTIAIQNGTGGTSDSCGTLSTGVWYRLEARYLLSDTVGQLELRRYTGDSTSPDDTCGIGNFAGGNGTDEDTLVTNVQSFRFGSVASATMNIFVDDFAWNQCAVADQPCTGFQESWLGPGKIATLIPAAEGATIQWTPLSGTDNALMVDEMPTAAPDDATTYNASSTAAQLDILTLTDLPAEVTSDATIVLAHVAARVGGDGTTGSPTMRVNLYDEADTKTTGPTSSASDISGWAILPTNHALVYDATGKTKTNVASFKAGYEIVTDTTVEQRVTALWVNVEWLESAAPPAGGGRRLLLGVGQ